jgi:hypothetical protein
MTDLTNKVDALILNDLKSLQDTVNNYGTILELLKKKDDIPYVGFIVDIGVKHIRKFHEKETPDLKAWSIVVLKDLFQSGVLKTEEQIPELIDEFIEHYKKDFRAYKENHVAVNDYYMELGFVMAFEKQKRQ